MNWKKMDKLIRYLRQPSTWQGIVMVLGACGIAISPEMSAAILTGGGLLVGIISILKDDDK